METELMCDYSCFFFSPLFCFFLVSPHLNFSSSLVSCILLSSAFLLLYAFIFCFFLFCLIFAFGSFILYVLHSFASLSLCLPLSAVLSYPSAKSSSSFLCPPLSLSLRSQWVWLRGECGVPPPSLAIKAMPTPRLHMSSHLSKRGGVLLIRSVSHNTNTPRQMSICLCICLSAHLLFCLPHWQKMSVRPSLCLESLFENIPSGWVNYICFKYKVGHFIC